MKSAKNERFVNEVVFQLGADSFGKDYRAALERLSIPVNLVKACEGFSSGMASIIVDANGIFPNFLSGRFSK